MTQNENKRARERAMMLHRQFRVDAVAKIAQRYGYEVALQFERNAPMTFDTQVAPELAKIFSIPLYARFSFFIYQN